MPSRPPSSCCWQDLPAMGVLDPCRMLSAVGNKAAVFFLMLSDSTVIQSGEAPCHYHSTDLVTVKLTTVSRLTASAGR